MFMASPPIRDTHVIQGYEPLYGGGVRHLFLPLNAVRQSSNETYIRASSSREEMHSAGLPCLCQPAWDRHVDSGDSHRNPVRSDKKIRLRPTLSPPRRPPHRRCALAHQPRAPAQHRWGRTSPVRTAFSRRWLRSALSHLREKYVPDEKRSRRRRFNEAAHSAIAW